MNARRAIVYLLLSLLLVLSQQMGIAHALTHWSSQRTALTAGATSDAAPSKTGAAVDQSCDQCLAFAQIGTAVDTGFYSFPLSRDNATAVYATVAPQPCRRTVCVFHSRAPPVLS